MRENIEIKGYRLDINALDFGLYGRFLYFIDGKGRVEINKFMSPLEDFFNSTDFFGKPLTDILKYQHPVTIADIKDFPIDSIIYNRELFIASGEYICIIPLKLPKNNSVFSRLIILKNVISFAKSKGWLFISKDKDGLTLFNSHQNFLANLPFSSSRVDVAENNFINIHPDFPPKVFSILPVRSKLPQEKFALVAHSHSSMIVENIEANEIISKRKITGRDIVYSDIEKSKVNLYLDTGAKFTTSIDTSETESSDPVQPHALKIYDSLSSRQENNQDKITSDRNNIFPLQTISDRNNNDWPLEFFPFRGGYIVQYWDHVDYIDNEGTIHPLAKDMEIARVRTYPTHSTYASYISIATENGCWLYRIIHFPPSSRKLPSSPLKRIPSRPLIKN